MFKKGDLVICIDSIGHPGEDPDDFIEKGQVCKVSLVSKEWGGYWIDLEDYSPCGENHGRFKGICFEKAPLNNPLNKKLYPNRKEYEGFLIPEKTAENLARK